MGVRPPPHGRQGGHRSEDQCEGPVIQRAGSGVAARALGAQHGEKASDDAREPNEDVCGDHGQKDWGPGWDRDPKDNEAVVCHSEPGLSSSVGPVYQPVATRRRLTTLRISDGRNAHRSEVYGPLPRRPDGIES